MKLKAFIQLIRPHQWLKNLVLFFPPFLGGRMTDLSVLLNGAIPFVAFCLASSSTYIVNDIVDAPNDVRHPKKKTRPIAAGTVSSLSGYLMASTLGAVSLVLAFQVPGVFLWVLIGYMVLSLLYTVKLKDVAIVDLFCIAIFFLLRLTAGGQAFGVPISDWLFLSVFLLALFLATGKRLCEKSHLGEIAADHRKSLRDYPEGLLDGIMYMTGGAVLVTYTLYVINRHGMIYTVPLCCFGLMRYMFRVKIGRGGDPTYALLQDPMLFVVGGLWTFTVGYWIYFG
jgi:decaprenyl-phosphate phosphoribosyltransferase